MGWCTAARAVRLLPEHVMNRTTRRWSLAASLLCAAPGWAQVLVVNSDSLTSYKSTSASSIQSIRPLVIQRAVGVDGALRAGSTQGWALAGNPFGESWDGNGRLGGLNLGAGTYQPTEVDLALPAPGASRWVIGRTFNQRQETSSPAHRDSNGYQGYNWFQASQPEIVLYTNSGDHTKDLVYLVFGADRFIEFQRTGASSNEYLGTNGAAGVVQYLANNGGAGSEPDTWTYTDQNGVQTAFFGFDADAGTAAGQVWKITDPAGNVAYVGDPTTASTAISSGYSSGRITVAYDGAGRRYCYTYTASIGGSVRLSQVLVETPISDGFGACGEDLEIARVAYDYYTSDGDDHGKAGDLKLVTITTPLTDSGIAQVKKKYYRYYDDTWSDSDGRRGESHCLKMVVGFEGYRRYDWDQDSNLDDDPLTATDANLKPYCEAYFETIGSSDYRLKSAFFNGECGCSGGVNGTHTFSYDAYGSYTDNSGYDTTWCRRTVVARPDGSYVAQYFDECAQPLSRIIADGALTGSPSKWVTQAVRDSAGCVTEIRTPEANTGYTHDSGGPPAVPDGSLTSSSSAGLIHVFTRYGSGDKTGYVEYRKHKKGTSGTAYPDSLTDYTIPSLTVGSSAVAHPSVSSSKAYRDTTESGGSDTYDETTVTLTYWSASSSNVLSIVSKSIVTTFPKVSTGNNGKGSGGGDAAVEAKRYLRKDFTTAFSMRPAYSDAANSTRVYDYTQFTNGQLTKRIADATTNGSFASGDDPNTDWGITETGDGWNVITQYTYDAQGRPNGSTLPDGRVTLVHYSRLSDHRMTTVSCPRVSGGYYYGPLSYTVTNQAGRADYSGVDALAAAGINTALTGWIDETDADAVTAVDIGKITRLTRTVHSKPGSQVDESRVYTTIPSSIGGESASNYDKALFGYDTMGRRYRSVTPAGTIARTVFNARGLAIEMWSGTDDNSAGSLTGGTSDMTKAQALAYDGGSANKNSLLTSRTMIVDETDDGGDPFDDDRVTTYTYDYRGRLLLATNPQSPHILSKYDNLGRVLATGQYSGTGSITPGTTDPAATGTQTDRIGLSRNFYDEMGRVWKSQRHKIDITDGSDDDNLQTLTWRDARGRVVKVDGEQLTKTGYDRLDRVTRQFTLIKDNDSTYADTLDVSGDYVAEEHQTVYQDGNSNKVIMRVAISRLWDDMEGNDVGAGLYDNTGVLDSGADNDLLLITAANLLGRAQITATWYDSLDRPTTTALYGTYGGADFDRDGLAEPSASASDKIVSKTAYTYDDGGTTRDDGLVHETTDPRGKVTRTIFDAMGRRTATIANYVNGTPSGTTGDDDVYTRYEYADGHMTKMWVDFDGDNVVDSGDQVTTYLYGCTKATPSAMKLSSKDLLRAVKYPDSTNAGTTAAYIDGTSDADVVSFAYNAQGQETSKKDQAGNVIETRFDTGGRAVHTMASTVASGFDSAVVRITRTFTSRGQLDTVTQFSSTTIGTPDTSNVVDQVDFDYEDWGNVSTITQDVDSIVGASGRAAFAVSYTYAKNTTGRNTIKRTKMTYPDSTDLQYDFLNGSGRMDGYSSRVSRVRIGLVTAASTYLYHGMAGVVQEKHDPVYTERDIADLGAHNSFPAWDDFNRLVADHWYGSLAGASFHDLEIAYDYSSNITSIKDNVRKKSGGDRNFDAKYTIDGLNRLTQAEEGQYAAGVITGGKRSRQEDWTLTQVGDWSNHKIDLNGDNDWIDGGGEVQEDDTFNDVNELTQRQLDTAAGGGYETTYSSIAYDAVGNLTDDKQNYKYVWDVFGRLRQVKNQSSNLVEEFTYNGLNYRIGWHYDVDADGTVENTSDDPWYYFACDDRWRNIATFRASDTSPKEQIYYHNAGLGGFGGSSYIDDVAWRDRDANTNWRTVAGDGVLEERRYLCHDWRHDVCAVVTDAGKLVETVKYSSYGVAFGIPAGISSPTGPGTPPTRPRSPGPTASRRT
jgi:YD repeat-containing protein